MNVPIYIDAAGHHHFTPAGGPPDPVATITVVEGSSLKTGPAGETVIHTPGTTAALTADQLVKAAADPHCKTFRPAPAPAR